MYLNLLVIKNDNIVVETYIQRNKLKAFCDILDFIQFNCTLLLVIVSNFNDSTLDL